MNKATAIFETDEDMRAPSIQRGRARPAMYVFVI